MSFIKNVNFTQKKKLTFQITTDNVEYGLTSFTQNLRKSFGPNCSSTKKLDLFEYDQKSGIKVRKYGHIWGSLFPVSWNETEKKVTSSDSQNYHL